MKVNNAGRTNNERRTSWESPAVRKVAIGAETKSAAQGQDNEVRVFVRDGHSDVCPYRQQVALLNRT